MTPTPGVVHDESQGTAMVSGPALFLDRDGVINADHGYVHTPDDTDWVPGIFDLCRRASELGMPRIVVTNQAGIARGLYTEASFRQYTTWMHGEFARRGTPLLATFYCPHHPQAGLGGLKVDCDCRKPGAAMLEAASRMYGIDLSTSVLVGDKVSDIQAGRAAGIGRCFLLRDVSGLAPGGAVVVRSLEEVSEALS